MKILFFGTPLFAVPALEKILETSHQVVSVVTRADKPSGRGQKITPSPVKKLAEERGISVLQPENVKTDEFAAQVQALAPDVAIVVAYGKILPKRILDIPKHGCLNIHASLLPAYRGAAPIQWSIIRGETKTGVTIMQMDEGMDTGPIIAQQEVDILDDDDSVSLGSMLSYSGAALLIDVLAKLESEGTLAKTPQDNAGASSAPLIKREMARVDWTKRHDEIICAVHGFYPWPKAFTTLKDEELKITGAEAWDPTWVPATAFDVRIKPGTVVENVKGRGIVVRAGNAKGLVLITRVQLPGKSEMEAQDLVNGGTVDVGTILGK